MTEPVADGTREPVQVAPPSKPKEPSLGFEMVKVALIWGRNTLLGIFGIAVGLVALGGVGKTASWVCFWVTGSHFGEEPEPILTSPGFGYSMGVGVGWVLGLCVVLAMLAGFFEALYKSAERNMASRKRNI